MSPTSTVSRGRTITKVVTEAIADSPATLATLAANMAFNDSQIYETVTLTTSLMPMHSDSDVISLGASGLGLLAGTKYAETSWTMPLSPGGAMVHSLRRVVSV